MVIVYLPFRWQEISVCSKRFVSTDYVTTPHTSRKRLSADTTPSDFAWAPSLKHRTPEECVSSWDGRYSETWSHWSITELYLYHHCGETITIIAVTTIQDGRRRRQWVRTGPHCDACTQHYTLVSLHNMGASSASILRALLCWFGLLFLKYGLVKLLQYDRYLQNRHRRYDRNCPGAVIVTVENWS